MTIVAALSTPGGMWIGADSLASNTEIRVESATPKVYRCQNFLFGYAGSYRLGRSLLELTRADPDMTVKDLAGARSLPGRDWEALLVDRTGIYELVPGGGLIKVKAKNGYAYDAIGSGTGPALGSLYSWHDGRDALVSALHAAESHTNRVRRPFKIVSL